MSCRSVFAFALVVVTLSGLAVTAHARPTYKSALAGYVGSPLPAKLNDCRTCHSPAPNDDPSMVNGRTLNPYGRRLRAVVPELRASKKRAGITNRLEAVSDEDTDGDGASNLLELLTGRFPGDPHDTPSVEERERGRKTLEELRRTRSQ